MDDYVNCFQSYLSPCLTFDILALTLLFAHFQSYLSPCLTFPLASMLYERYSFNPTLVRV